MPTSEKILAFVNRVAPSPNLGAGMDLADDPAVRYAMEKAARDVESSVGDTTEDCEKSWSDATGGLDLDAPLSEPVADTPVYPAYQRPKKNWRLKRGAVPQWYKARAGVRTRTQSGAARVARFRPRSPSAPRRSRWWHPLLPSQRPPLPRQMPWPLPGRPKPS